MKLTLIEDAGIGPGLISTLQQEYGLNVKAVKPSLDKQLRAEMQLGVLESGRILFPDNREWMKILEAEFLAFPRGKHDDQIDSVTQFLSWASQHFEPAHATGFCGVNTDGTFDDCTFEIPARYNISY